jgi:TPR repeat protein
MQKDLHVAYSIAEKGASLGCDDSKAALASCLRFVWRDEERAVQLAKESACAGSAWGCSELGLILQHGIGVERDVAQAVLYTAKAARHGNAWARNNLGIMYAKGFGVERDYRQAERYASRTPN